MTGRQSEKVGEGDEMSEDQFCDLYCRTIRLDLVSLVHVAMSMGQAKKGGGRRSEC